MDFNYYFFKLIFLKFQVISKCEILDKNTKKKFLGVEIGEKTELWQLYKILQSDMIKRLPCVKFFEFLQEWILF